MRMLQHQTAAAASLFPVALVLHTLQLEQQVDPGLVRGHVYFLCLVDAKYRAIWLYLHCAGGGGVILWHLSCLCKELAVCSFSSSPCKQRDSRWEQQPWFRVASPVSVFSGWHWASVFCSVQPVQVLLPLRCLFSASWLLQINSQTMCMFYVLYTLLLSVLSDLFFAYSQGEIWAT